MGATLLSRMYELIFIRALRYFTIFLTAVSSLVTNADLRRSYIRLYAADYAPLLSKDVLHKTPDLTIYWHISVRC